MDDMKCSTCKGVGRLEFEQGQRRVPCVTCSGSGIDWRKTCEVVQQDAEVLRYDLQVAHSVINAHKPDFDAQRLRADTAEAELAVLKHEIECRIGAEVNAVEALAAAEQRIADQLKLIVGLVEYADNRLSDVNSAWQYAGSTGNPETHRDTDYVAAVAMLAALNPKPEAGSHEVAREALKMENQHITPARFKCLACGGYHEGSGNLPCPKTIPYAGV